MKNLKKFATTLALAGIIMMGVSSANAGIMLADLVGGNNDQPCSTEVKVDSGIIIGGLTGIIIGGFTGIIIGGLKDNNCVKVDSGILMSD
jgi:hypothetical protein